MKYQMISGGRVHSGIEKCAKGKNYIASESGVSNVGDLLVRFVNGMNDRIRDKSEKRVLIFSNYEKKKARLSLDSNVVVLPWEGRVTCVGA